jgi:hypothetical protein
MVPGPRPFYLAPRHLADLAYVSPAAEDGTFQRIVVAAGEPSRLGNQLVALGLLVSRYLQAPRINHNLGTRLIELGDHAPGLVERLHRTGTGRVGNNDRVPITEGWVHGDRLDLQLRKGVLDDSSDGGGIAVVIKPHGDALHPRRWWGVGDSELNDEGLEIFQGIVLRRWFWLCLFVTDQDACVAEGGQTDDAVYLVADHGDNSAGALEALRQIQDLWRDRHNGKPTERDEKLILNCLRWRLIFLLLSSFRWQLLNGRQRGCFGRIDRIEDGRWPDRNERGYTRDLALEGGGNVGST